MPPIVPRSALKWIMPVLLGVGVFTWMVWTADATHPVVALGLVALAVLAAVGTSALARSAWSGWTELGSADEVRPSVRPSSELDTTGGSAPWTAARLKQTLERHLQGEQV